MKKLLCILTLCGILLSGCGNQQESTPTVENVQATTEQMTEAESETVTESETESDSETETESEAATEMESESEIKTEDCTQDWERIGVIMNSTFRKNQMDLAITLLKRRAEQDYNQNILISPFSISTALALTANGSDGSTRNQMEQFFGQDISSLNNDLKWYTDNLLSSEASRLVSANSLWIKQTDDMTVNEDFLKIADDTYQASVFEEPFNAETADKINHWISENTDHMIDKIVDSIGEDAMLYLVNALTFEAQWKEAYKDFQIEDDTFTALNGTERTVSMMTNTEDCYLDDGNAIGFMKPYAKYGYYFVALLPNENTDIRNYLNTLDAESLLNLLDNLEYTDVIVQMPAFEDEYEVSLNDTLQNMGMADAFSDNADFSRMADAPLKISSVLHKTYISVDQNGTKAAAATSVEMWAGSAADEEETEPKSVILNRPFVYMIVDDTNHLPLFIGTVTDIT